ncbi:MAG: hypothetical protein ACI87E_003605 [Mariniblastus sp.]|jgi:hypothetical protein
MFLPEKAISCDEVFGSVGEVPATGDGSLCEVHRKHIYYYPKSIGLRLLQPVSQNYQDSSALKNS